MNWNRTSLGTWHHFDGNGWWNNNETTSAVRKEGTVTLDWWGWEEGEIAWKTEIVKLRVVTSSAVKTVDSSVSTASLILCLHYDSEPKKEVPHWFHHFPSAYCSCIYSAKMTFSILMCCGSNPFSFVCSKLYKKIKIIKKKHKLNCTLLYYNCMSYNHDKKLLW